MPELPEVQTVIDAVAPQVVGRRILTVAVSDHLKRHGGWAPACLRGQVVHSVVRRGKFIILRLVGTRGRTALHIHLAMSGTLRTSHPNTTPPPHSHLRLKLSPVVRDTSQPPAPWLIEETVTLHFVDPRRFGTIKCYSSAEALRDYFSDRVGPDVFDLLRQSDGNSVEASRSMERKIRRIYQPTMQVKSALLDQRAVSGFGNIYAAETLFRARVNPTRELGDLTRADLRRTFLAGRDVLLAALDAHGTTISSYRQPSGESGGGQMLLRVYGREGEPCYRRTCSGTVTRINQGGRSTFWCERCQV